jgi:hypothetical protein
MDASEGLPGLGGSGSAAFDEAMYAPSSPLAVVSRAQATNAASSAGVQSTGGSGTGALLQAIKHQ